MDHGDYFKDEFEPIPDYRKIVISIILIEKKRLFRRMWIFQK